ncbi:Bardet-Biedl syndrome 5 protein homolog [Coccinella septempunctata]|uniref:Bardet-Biedl syndrome 5 protein homolog n=1 Tax=Coccinella septempunctata TaxID=41139 RepID=UPI001D071EED|nr:Bardet-Biedl syndrome 5 protein homolog [Coccinella septempunctata]
MFIWEDKEVRFDIPFTEMRLRSGEKIIDCLEDIEDTKGNAGDRGRLVVTNLRILWHSITSPRINLTIGFNCILSINTKEVNSRVNSTAKTLHMLTMSNKTRFEFIFTNLVPGSTRLVTVSGVHRAYLSSKLYREIKLRGALVQNKQLKILPLEHVYTTVDGVWNLSSDQGSLGTFIVTNVRCAWFASMNEGFNISLPHIQIISIIIRDSKFGPALVITSSEESGGYVLGFRLDSEENMSKLYKEITVIHTTTNNNPIYGVEYKLSALSNEEQNSDILQDAEVIEDPKGEITNTIAAYLAEGVNKSDRPIYSLELGLAVESIKNGFTIQKLWEVIPPTN